MKQYAILCIKGGSKALASELSEAKVDSKEGGMDWREATLSEKQLENILNYGQAATQVIEILTRGDIDAIAEFAKTIKPSGSFCVRSDAEERVEMQENIGAHIKENSGASVKLSNPDFTYAIHESEGELILGVDVSGNLAKRHYKIISGAQSLSGPFAYAALRIAGFSKKTDLVVWPCGTGELAIEAALSASGKSPRAYERKVMESHDPTCKIVCADPKLSLVRSAEKNAKVAGINQAIRFSRQDADWLDTKYEEHKVTLLVGLLPNLKIYPKLVKELYYQLEYILKPGGAAHFLCVNEESANSLEEQSKGYEARRTYLWQGKHCFTLVSLIREKKVKKKA